MVEDCAIAVGSRFHGRHVGLFGEVGCFSFYPVKHITAGEGGMVVTRDPRVAQRINLLRAFGVDRCHGERVRPGQYDVATLGLNYRMVNSKPRWSSQLRRVGHVGATSRQSFRAEVAARGA